MVKKKKKINFTEVLSKINFAPLCQLPTSKIPYTQINKKKINEVTSKNNKKIGS